MLLHTILSGHLYSTFIRLCAGVAKEYFGKPCVLAQLLGYLYIRLCTVQIRRVLQLVCLFRHRICPPLICITQAVHTDSTCEINVLLSFRIFRDRSTSLCQSDRKTLVCICNIFTVFVLNVNRVHVTSPFNPAISSITRPHIPRNDTFV